MLRADRPPLRHPHPADRGDARRDGARPRSATTCTARTRPSSPSRSGWPGCSGTRPRCSRPPGRWPTCSPSARWSRPARRCSASRRRTSPAPSSARTARSAGSRCAPGPPAGPGRPGRDPVDVRARHGPVLRAAPRPSRSRTPTTSPGGAVLPLADLQALRAWADRRRRRRAPRRRPDLERARGHRRPARASTAPSRRRAVGLPVQGARRPGRLADGRARDDAIDRGAGAAQADGRRDAPGRHPGRRRAARPRPPRRAARRGPRARPAAGRGLRRRPGDRRHQHRGGRPRSDAAAFVAAAARGRACGSRRSARPPVRMVTHLDVSPADAERAAAVLAGSSVTGRGRRQASGSRRANLADRGEVAGARARRPAARPRPAGAPPCW